MTKGMQDKIEQHPEYNTTIKKNPIELLKAIKILMHDTMRSQYPMFTRTTALVWLVANLQTK